MSTRAASDKQEKRITKDLKKVTNTARKVTGSGATDFQKGDVKTEDLFIEAKTKMTPSSSIKVSKEWFTKAKEQAFQMRKWLWAVVFDFGDGVDYYAQPKEQFIEFYEAYKQVERLEKYMSTDPNGDLSIKVRNILKGD